jgi:hypothetical protein
MARLHPPYCEDLASQSIIKSFQIGPLAHAIFVTFRQRRVCYILRNAVETPTCGISLSLVSTAL